MVRITIEQCATLLKPILKINVKIKCISCTSRFLGEDNRPTETALAKIGKKYKESGSVVALKLLVHPVEIIASVCKNVVESPDGHIGSNYECRFVSPRTV